MSSFVRLSCVPTHHPLSHIPARCRYCGEVVRWPIGVCGMRAFLAGLPF